VLLVTTTDVTGGDVTVVVTASSFRFFLNQGCERTAFVQVGFTTFTMPRRPGEVGFILTSAII
jgi:hypothetical protein